MLAPVKVSCQQPLHGFLALGITPVAEKGVLTVKELSDRMGLSRQAIYLALEDAGISPEIQGRRGVEGAALSQEQLDQFVDWRLGKNKALLDLRTPEIKRLPLVGSVCAGPVKRP